MNNPRQIIIIKTEPRIDVLRATSVLQPLKNRHPNANIVWVTSRRNRLILETNDLIDELLCIEDASTISAALNRTFQALYSFDINPGTADLANLINAEAKFGFHIDSQGNTLLFNDSASALQLYEEALSNIQVESPVTYQTAVMEAAGFDSTAMGEMVFNPKPEAKAFAERFAADNQIHPGDKPVVIIYLGFNPARPPEYYPPRLVSFLSEYLLERLDAEVVLLGGMRERNIYQSYFVQCPPGVHDGGCENSFHRLTGLLDMADLIIASDSLGLHIALALGKKAAALLGSAAPGAIELYGRGTGLSVSMNNRQILQADLAKYYQALSAIPPEEVYNAVESLLNPRIQ